MYKYIELIVKCLGGTLGTFLHKAVDAISSTFKVFDHYLSYKERISEKEEKKANESKIIDACDNGSLDDLFNLKSTKILAFASLCVLCGCASAKIQL